MKEILPLRYGDMKRLAKKAKCSEMHARMCLRGSYDTPKAMEIREIALEMGFIEVDKNN